MTTMMDLRRAMLNFVCSGATRPYMQIVLVLLYGRCFINKVSINTNEVDAPICVTIVFSVLRLRACPLPLLLLLLLLLQWTR